MLLVVACSNAETEETVASSDVSSASDAPFFFAPNDVSEPPPDVPDASRDAVDAPTPDTTAPADPGPVTPDANGVDAPDDPNPYCGLGSVHGRICAPAEQLYVDGATVWVDAEDCDGTLVHRETVTDDDGFYTLHEVPSGLQTLHVVRGDFARTYAVDIPINGTSDVTGAAYKECFRANELECTPGLAVIPVESKIVEGIADIVMFIDTSGSMDDETKWVQQNLNAFATLIDTANVDSHVVLIGEAGGDLCVPEPLGGPNCTDGPNFRHVHVSVGSNDGLEIVRDTYPIYADFLREGATTNFVAISDDNSDLSASKFTTWVNAQTNPGFSADWKFHSIVAMGPIPIVGCIGGAFGGLVYLQLSNNTGGATYPVCNTDWTAMLGQLANSVVGSIDAACIYSVPDSDQLAGADTVTLAWHGPQVTMFFARKASEADCGPQGGWFVDDPAAPEHVILCPASCDALTTGDLALTMSCDP